jgi:hypothetical protein
MKKTAIALALAGSMGVGAAQAAFLMPGSSGTITVTTGCFTFGVCAVDGVGPDDITDNAILVNGIGSGIAADGVRGIMNFTVGMDGNSISLTSFNMDTYTGTAGGDFATRMVNTASAGGVINDNGSMSLDLTGRTGIAQFFIATLGEQPWNLDTHTVALAPGCAPGTGSYTLFTTGSSTNLNCATGLPNATIMGSALVGGGGTWTGTIVSAGNVGGPQWNFFDGTPYTEIFNITVTGIEAPTAVPVPAAVWLFGSGLLGLVGIARRKKKA